MPNHVTTTITSESKQAMSDLMSFMKSEDSEFDFNNIAPIPDKLANVRHGSIVIDGEKFESWIGNEDGSLTGVNEGELLKECGYPSWYEFCCRQWGTKWNAYEIQIEDDQISFCTAWSTPTPILQAIAKKYTQHVYEVHWIEEQGFGGTFSLYDGECEEESEWGVQEFTEVTTKDGVTISVCVVDDNPETMYGVGYIADEEEGEEYFNFDEYVLRSKASPKDKEELKKLVDKALAC